MDKLDVLIIGTGTAGQTAAFDLVAEGYRVAVVEKSDKPGGVCALAGCQAKKWFYELTETVARAHHLKGLGITGMPSASWKQVRTAKNEFTAKVPKNTVDNLKGNGIDYIEGEAVFADPDTVLINGNPFKPRFTIIATGAAPMSLPIAGSEHLATNVDFLDLEQLPERITFIGGGFISFEFAHFAARLGARPEEVRILEVSDRVLGPFDSDMVAQLVAATRAEGIQVVTETTVKTITRESSGFILHFESGKRMETDLVVHGAGRAPNIEPLNLKAAGINFSKGGIEVDGHMRTSNQKVFAVGDCAATLQLARVADREAKVACATIAAHDTKESAEPIDYQAAPSILFTYPQLGMVGKTEDELISQGVRYWRSFDTELSWPTYRRIGMKHAAYKILVDNDNLILGAHILSDHAIGLINTFKQAMIDDKTVDELYRDNIMSPYPSQVSDITYMLKPLMD